MKSAISFILTCLFVFMYSGVAFADVPRDEITPNGMSAQVAADPDSIDVQMDVQPVVIQPVWMQPQVTGISDDDWEKESRIYKGVGWGLFASGVLIGGVLGGAIVGNSVVELDRIYHDEDSGFAAGLGYEIGKAIGGIIMGVGGAVMISGLGVLIAEGVKFSPYRRGEIAGHTFDWSPEVYVSPEFNGLGISARF